MRMPQASAMRARLGALRFWSSQPVRIFKVTGRRTAWTVASRMRAAWTSSRISEEPAWPLTTFFTGQPKLMSMSAAPRSSLSLAASAMTSGSHPASWTAMGYSSGEFSAMRMVWRDSRIIAWLAIISETTSPAPSRFTRRRNGMSETPDMGARKTGSSIRTGPTVMAIFCAIGVVARSCPIYRQRRGIASSAQDQVRHQLDPRIGQGQQHPGQQDEPCRKAAAQAGEAVRRQQPADDREGQEREHGLVAEANQFLGRKPSRRRAGEDPEAEHDPGRGEEADLQPLGGSERGQHLRAPAATLPVLQP